jgi:hypothetical protein
VQRSFLGVSRRCQKCDAASPIWESVCLDCGHRMLPSGWLKFGGTLFIIMGTGIAGTLIYIMWWMAGVMLNNGPDARDRFTGTPLQAVGIFALLSAVTMFGVTYVMMGAWWILRGTRSPWIIRIGMAVYFLLTFGFVILQLWD